MNDRAAIRKESEPNKLIKALIERDGLRCFYCDKNMRPHNITIEHLIPKTRKGGNGLENLVLAHKACNQRAGTLTLKEKIDIRVGVLTRKRGNQ